MDGKHTETIKKDTTITVTEGNLTEAVKAGAQSTTVKNDIDITSEAAAIYLTAKTEMKLSVGSSTIFMKADGTINITGVNISVEGNMIAVDGDTKVGIHSMTVENKGDQMVSIEAPQVMSDGKATNIVKGGMVMLNPG